MDGMWLARRIIGRRAAIPSRRLTSNACRLSNSISIRAFSAPTAQQPARSAPLSRLEQARPGDVVHGWELLRSVDVHEFNAQGYLLRHQQTGAQLMSMVTEDENKTFGVTFQTPPADDTGAAHIMEHSVLCGSKKYRIKEPFVELMKSSLNTYLNAFTYPGTFSLSFLPFLRRTRSPSASLDAHFVCDSDKIQNNCICNTARHHNYHNPPTHRTHAHTTPADRTVYPVASCNLRDFYNLVDVYLDAVFFPVAVHDPRILKQEGWHHEVDSADGPIAFKGVVFNEMKGVYSDPEALESRAVQRALFPDNAYSFDNAGDPPSIPSLTFERFRQFHSDFYHPSNARFWFYGDDPADDRLAILNDYLQHFTHKSVDNAGIRTQQPFSSPKRIQTQYPVGAEEENLAAKTMFTMNWVVTFGQTDVQTELGLGFLNYLLLGTSASPLYKALTDSQLGSCVIGGGLCSELKQQTFSVGMKDMRAEDCGKLEALVTEVLRHHAEHGFTEDAVAAAVNTIEFSLRENNTGSSPRGLSLMLRSMSRWVYAEDPFKPLQFERPLAELKERIASGEPVFQALIRRHLLDNPHRVSHESNPSLTLADEQEAREESELAAVQSSATPEQLQEMMEQTQQLREYQETPDPPEALAVIPSLDLNDMPERTADYPLNVDKGPHGSELLTTDLFTNGVAYLTVGFPLASLSAQQLQLLPLFSASLRELGTETEDFVTLSQRIGKSTGGVYSSLSFMDTNDHRGSGQPGVLQHLFLKGKAMSPQVPAMLDIMRDMALTANLDNKERFQQLVVESKAALESDFVSSGHSLAASRLNAQYTACGRIGELTGGLSYYRYLNQLLKEVESDWESVLVRLRELQRAIFRQNGAFVHVTADRHSLDQMHRSLSDFVGCFPVAQLTAGDEENQTPLLLPRYEGARVRRSGLVSVPSLAYSCSH